MTDRNKDDFNVVKWLVAGCCFGLVLWLVLWYFASLIS